MRENINALDELNKGCNMGMNAIKFIIDKVEDKNFEKVLKIQYKEYKNISQRINKLYDDYTKDEKKPHKTSIMNKVMTWSGIEMKTIDDTSNSKIAELLLNGTNMGIIEGRKLMNNKNIDKEVHELIDKYVSFQEKSVEELKKYL